MSKKVIIYDFDGVIVDSSKAVVLYYESMFKAYDIPLPDWTDPVNKSNLLSMSNIQMIDYYAGNISVKIREEMIYYIPDNQSEIQNSTKLENGIQDVLAVLSKHYTLAICTNRGQSIQNYLSSYSISQYFSYVVTALDVNEAKPSPEGVYKILNKFGANKALYIGDSGSDYLAAKNAGVNFLAFRNDLYDSVKIMEHKEVFDHLVLI